MGQPALMEAPVRECLRWLNAASNGCMLTHCSVKLAQAHTTSSTPTTAQRPRVCGHRRCSCSADSPALARQRHIWQAGRRTAAAGATAAADVAVAAAAAGAAAAAVAAAAAP